MLQVASSAMLSLILHSSRLFGIEPHAAYVAYYYSYWVSYFGSALLIFFVLQEIFRHLMKPLPGIARLGVLAFRWVAITSVILSLGSAAMSSGFGRSAFIAIPHGFVRCVSLLELCLLAFLALSVHTLGLSFRSRVFGIGFGFGVLACMDFLTSALVFRYHSMASPLSLLTQAVTVVGILTWSAYFWLPEPERKVIALPVTSPLLRWNEIAATLGQPEPKVVVGASSDFFLQDVERVVDKILTKNSMNHAG